MERVALSTLFCFVPANGLILLFIGPIMHIFCLFGEHIISFFYLYGIFLKNEYALRFFT